MNLLTERSPGPSSGPDASADLSLVIPTYDEERRLPETLECLARFSRQTGLAVDVIVADDGSRDDTPAVARSWAADRRGPDFGVRLVTIAHRGKGAAVRAGLRMAHAPVVGYCDADMSAGTDALAALYREVKDGADIAIASRALAESVLEVRQAWYRERAGRVFNALLRRLTGIRFHDTQCGLKLFRQEAAAEILRHQRVDGFAFDAEVVLVAVRLGFEVKEVAVRWAHKDGSKVSMVRDSVLMLRDIFRIVRPLRRGQLHTLGVPHEHALDTMASSERHHWWYVAKRKLITQSWPERARSGRCLDVGCGGGAVLDQARQFMDAVGVDLSPRALQHGRAAGLSMLLRAEAGSLPFPSGSFDVALALDVLEHHPDPDRLLTEIRRVLSVDGVLILTVPAFQWMWSYADHVLGHYRRYTARMLDAELTGSGFELHRLTYFHSWLLPLAWVFRRIRSLTGRTGSADDFALPDPVNRMLLAVSKLELLYLARRDLPFGLSVLAVATPAPVATEGRTG